MYIDLKVFLSLKILILCKFHNFQYFHNFLKIIVFTLLYSSFLFKLFPFFVQYYKGNRIICFFPEHLLFSAHSKERER